MNSLSVREFKRVCDSLTPHKFILASENQKSRYADSLKGKLTFKIMVIEYNPNTIYLKNTESSLQLDRVKSIEMSEEKSLLGTVFTVVCGDYIEGSHDRLYTIIAQ